MNTILRRIAAAIGFLLFVLALAIGLWRDVPILKALFRATMIMILGSVIVTVFFRYFAGVLYRFIEEQRRLQMELQAKQEAEKKAREQERMAGRG